MKYKAKCEDRVYFTVTIETDDPNKIEELVGEAVRYTTRHDLYDILSVEPIGDEPS